LICPLGANPAARNTARLTLKLVLGIGGNHAADDRSS
jgi:hypothetical protein